MNENWVEMMAYAPLTKEESDTDYQKEEDFKGVAKEVSVEDTLILVGETEDYFGTDDEQAEEVEEVDDEYDDYETLPEIPAVTCSAEEVFTDIYSDEEY